MGGIITLITTYMISGIAVDAYEVITNAGDNAHISVKRQPAGRAYHAAIGRHRSPFAVNFLDGRSSGAYRRQGRSGRRRVRICRFRPMGLTANAFHGGGMGEVMALHTPRSMPAQQTVEISAVRLHECHVVTTSPIAKRLP